MQKRSIILTLVIVMMLLAGCNVNLPETPGKAYEQAAKLAAEYQCTDSDSGKNLHDYGYTIELVNGQNIKNADTCAGSILYEAVCRQGEVKAIEKIDCQDYEMICTNGACAVSASTIDEQQCIDSDDGLNMMDFGFTTEFRNNRQITNDDKCTGNVLREAVCKQGITKATERVNCQDYGMVCLEGTCVQDDEEAGAGGQGPGLGGQGAGAGGQGQGQGNGAGAGEEEEGQGEAGAGDQGAGAAGGQRGPGGLGGIGADDLSRIGRDRLDNIGALADALERARGAGGQAGARGTTCTDSDNGINSAVAGTVRLNSDGHVTTWPDACSVDSPNTLLEEYCPEADARGVRQIDCVAEGKQCSNGACVPLQRADRGAGQAGASNSNGIEQIICTDSDNGQNPWTFGTVRETEPNGHSASFSDNCLLDGNKVSEQYCSDAHRRGSRTMDCTTQGGICRNGACVNRPGTSRPDQATCTDTDGGMVPEHRGTATSTLRGTPTTVSDQCSGDVLIEAYCGNDNLIATRNIRCGADETCSNGVCIVRQREAAAFCLDNDGDDYLTAGQITIVDEQFRATVEADVCVNENRLTEKICRGTAPSSKTYYCSDYGLSCLNGKCVQLRVGRMQQALETPSPAAQQTVSQAIRPPTIIKQYPILNTIAIKKLI